MKCPKCGHEDKPDIIDSIGVISLFVFVGFTGGLFSLLFAKNYLGITYFSSTSTYYYLEFLSIIVITSGIIFSLYFVLLYLEKGK